MRFGRALEICLVCCLVAGCEEGSQNRVERNLDVELVKALNNIGVENAIVAQHTLYPYHFVLNSDQLNELGRRDFGVLAGRFKENPGVLNVRRGDVPVELYERRVSFVTYQLRQAGVEVGRMGLSDGTPGGTGMSSNRVVLILAEETESLMPVTAGVQGVTAR